MKSETLTKSEKAWLKKLEKILMNPPSDRIGFYAVGDANLGVYDRSREDEINELLDNCGGEFGNCADTIGAHFGSVKSYCQIGSVAA